MQRPRQVKEITGQVFGRLTALRFTKTVPTKSGATAYWLFRCSCGNEIEVAGSSVRSGNTRSCGCLDRDSIASRNRRHGAAARGRKTPEYIALRNMLSRCYNSRHDHFARYGGRGIEVCDRWRFGEDGKSGFECFLLDVGPRPSPAHSIDRYPDNDGHYAPSNCRWADRSDQVRNSTAITEIETPRGRMSIIEAAEQFGIAYGCLRTRIRYGWDHVKAVTEPTRHVHTLFFRGDEITFRQAEKISGLDESTIKKRISAGYSPEAAITTPRQKPGPKARVSPTTPIPSSVAAAPRHERPSER